MDASACNDLLYLTVFSIVSLFFCLVWFKSKRFGPRLPQGTLGWPFIDESLEFILSALTPHPERFMDKRIKRYGKVFRSHLLGSKTIVSTDAEVSRMVLQNDGRTFVPFYPKSIRVLMGDNSILLINGGLQKRIHGLVGGFLKSERLKAQIKEDIEECVRVNMKSWEDGQLVYIQEEAKHIANSIFENQSTDATLESWGTINDRKKTKIVCTIGPSTNTKEMIWKLAEEGMNVARLNMSHGDHASHKKTIDLVKKYNAEVKDNVIAIMLDTKGPEVRSGDVPQPIYLKADQEFNFTIKRGICSEDTVTVNYDDFVNDVEVGDTLLVDGGMMALAVMSKTADTVKCKVIDGGELKSRRHLNVRGKSATLPSITEKDWVDIKFGVDNKVDFYAVSFVKDATVVHELKDYLKRCGADIHVIVKIESADSIPNLHSIISASDGAMVAHGDLGAELPIEEVPLLQEDIIRRCRSMAKPVIVATNMLESMINHPTSTRAEVSDIAIAVRQGADAVMLSGETAHGRYPLKAVEVMHTVALRTETSAFGRRISTAPDTSWKSSMSSMFAFHATTMANTLGTPIIVFTRTGSMAVRLSHYRPFSTVFAFTNEERVKQRLALYHGVYPIYMNFSDDAEETFSRALSLLVNHGLLKEASQVTLVQSGNQPIWRKESTHHIQVRKVQG